MTRRRRAAGRVGDSRRRPVLARLPAPAIGGEEINARFRVARRDLDSLRHAFEHRRLPRVRAAVGRVPPDRRVRAADRLRRDDDRRRRRPTASRSSGRPRRCGSTASGVRLDNLAIAKGTGAVTGAAFVGWDSHLLVQRRRPPHSGRATRLLRVSRTRRCRGWRSSRPAAAARSTRRATTYRFRVNDLFVGEEGGRAGHRHARAARQRAERRDRRRLAAPGGDRHRPHRADAAGRLRAHVPVPRQLARSVRAAVRAAAVAVHHRRRRAGRSASSASWPISITCSSTGRSTRSTCGCSTTRSRTRADPPRARSAAGEDRGAAARRRRHPSARLGHHRAARRADRAAGVGRRQPRHPSGLLPRRARLGPRRAARARSTARSAQPLFSGSATITDGRVRHFSLPNALDAINGDDSLRSARHPARRRGGDDGRRPRAVRRPDRVRRVPARRARTSRRAARRCTCGIPEGVRSVVDADLALRGNFAAPTLGGVVTVKSAIWSRRIDHAGQHLRSRVAAVRRRPAPAGAAGEAATTLPLQFDIQLLVPSTLRIENNLARLVANADLHAARHLRSPGRLRARRDRARRGDVRGAPLPHHARIDGLHEPGADRAVLRRRGRDERARAGADLSRDGRRSPARREQLQPTLSSDPPLPTADVLALLFSDVPRGGTEGGRAELRALQNPNQRADRHPHRARDAGARRPDLVGSRQGRRADIRRRHVPALAVADRSRPASSRRRG